LVGVNYADVCVRWGVYESAKKYVGWPITPGFEFSGVVVDFGPPKEGMHYAEIQKRQTLKVCLFLKHSYE
jgi:NADPH:quinone reductase-like Zn-dependent oxidoreductase